MKKKKNLNANYWASHSVKCTAVETVSAPWTARFVCILTVGWFFFLLFSPPLSLSLTFFFSLSFSVTLFFFSSYAPFTDKPVQEVVTMPTSISSVCVLSLRFALSASLFSSFLFLNFFTPLPQLHINQYCLTWAAEICRGRETSGLQQKHKGS